MSRHPSLSGQGHLGKPRPIPRDTQPSDPKPFFPLTKWLEKGQDRRGRCGQLETTRPSPVFLDTSEALFTQDLFIPPFAIFSANPLGSDRKKLNINSAFGQPSGCRVEGKDHHPDTPWGHPQSSWREQPGKASCGR